MTAEKTSENEVVTQIKVMKRCEVCKEVESKYKCPRCHIQTCCVSCVKQHKIDSSCSGERDKTAHVPTSDFTDIHLLNDYRFLEDVGRKNNNASRDVLKRGSNKPNFMKVLEKQAKSRRINLRLMPYPMVKRKTNSTTFQFKSKQILWQLEWKFPQAEFSIIDERITESNTLESALEKHIGKDADPEVRFRLRPYVNADGDDIAIFLRKDGTSGPNTRYYKMKKELSINDNLADKDIVEYPTFYVALKSHWSEYELVEEPEPILPQSTPSEAQTFPNMAPSDTTNTPGPSAQTPSEILSTL